MQHRAAYKCLPANWDPLSPRIVQSLSPSSNGITKRRIGVDSDLYLIARRRFGTLSHTKHIPAVRVLGSRGPQSIGGRRSAVILLAGGKVLLRDFSTCAWHLSVFAKARWLVGRGIREYLGSLLLCIHYTRRIHITFPSINPLSLALNMPDIAAFKQNGDVMSISKLPIIDISPYLNESSTLEERLATSKALDEACKTFGSCSFAIDVYRLC